MKVLNTSKTQPNREIASMTAAAIGFDTVQTGSGIGRHCQYSSSSARLENSTNVLRSIDVGTKRVHQLLKPGRAITLCWTANSPSSSVLTIRLSRNGPARPESCLLYTSDAADDPLSVVPGRRRIIK